jgi:hypothetical protein
MRIRSLGWCAAVLGGGIPRTHGACARAGSGARSMLG